MDVYLPLIQELPESIQLQIEQKVGIYLVSLGCIKKRNPGNLGLVIYFVSKILNRFTFYLF